MPRSSTWPTGSSGGGAGRGFDRLQPRGARSVLTIEQRWDAVTQLALAMWPRTEQTIDADDPRIVEFLRSFGDELRFLFITSQVSFGPAGEKAFVAGADIGELADMTASDAEQLAAGGQALMDRIECLGKPVIAAVNGFALGGGCELALACDYRIAQDIDSTRIGFPEIKLGIFPGFGGTARSTQLIGMVMAEWENPFYTRMLRQFSERLQAEGYQLLLMTSSSESDVDDVGVGVAVHVGQLVRPRRGAPRVDILDHGGPLSCAITLPQLSAISIVFGGKKECSIHIHQFPGLTAFITR